MNFLLVISEIFFMGLKRRVLIENWSGVAQIENHVHVFDHFRHLNLTCLYKNPSMLNMRAQHHTHIHTLAPYDTPILMDKTKKEFISNGTFSFQKQTITPLKHPFKKTNQNLSL